ncbi:unnamed protein product [Ectocarpus sp. CCAP 1310/34]|nr:unnamed protein product [Ectocarpus sp. CCAP 1310/34]
MGVMAAPCAAAGGLGAEEVTVTPESDGEELLSLFDCEGGEFNVSWSGEVAVPGTIYIGRGTTVRIFGEPGNSSSGSNATTPSSRSSSAAAGDSSAAAGSSGSSSTTSSSTSSSVERDQEWVEALSNRLPLLPNGLTSVAMGTFAAASTTTASSSGTSSSGNSSSSFPSNTQEGEEVETTTPTGPLFFVDGGQLFLDSLAVRGGYTSNSKGSFTYTASTDAADDGANSTTTSGVNETAIATVVTSGGGVHAIDSNVTVTGCEF